MVICHCINNYVSSFKVNPKVFFFLPNASDRWIFGLFLLFSFSTTFTYHVNFIVMKS